MISDLAIHYRELFDKYGDSPKSVQWSDSTTQDNRFKVLSEIGNLNGATVLDFGCGLGHFVRYLERQGIYTKYTGVDIVPEMIEYASKQYPNSRFCSYDHICKETFDYIFICGVFNNLIDDNRNYYQAITRKLMCQTKIGLGFNMLSSYVDFQDKGLFYEQPEEVIRFVKQELSPLMTLRHDYRIKKNVIPFEFTVYVYR